MKKIIFSIFLLISSYSFSIVTQSYFVGGGFNNDLENKEYLSSTKSNMKSDKISLEAGFSLDKLIYRDTAFGIELGLGAKYQYSILSEEYENDNYVDTIPVYLNLRYRTYNNCINYYLEGQIGYTYINEGHIVDDLELYLHEDITFKKDMYYGIEAGIEFSDFFLGYNYSSSNFSRNETTSLSAKDYSYNKNSIIFGIRF